MEGREFQPTGGDEELARSLAKAEVASERSSRLVAEADSIITAFLNAHENNHYREKLRTIFRGGIRA